MSIVGGIIARLWSKVMYSTSCVNIVGKLSKVKRKLSTYVGIVAVLPDTHQEDKFDAVCQILIERYGLKKLNSPFSGHSIFLYDGNNHIWEIDKTDTTVNEVRVKKPASAVYDQIMEFNELPKVSIHKASVQKDHLASMKIN
jgi:uncharacterized membrane protein